MSYYNQQQPPVGVPPQQGNPYNQIFVNFAFISIWICGFLVLRVFDICLLDLTLDLCFSVFFVSLFFCVCVCCFVRLSARRISQGRISAAGISRTGISSTGIPTPAGISSGLRPSVRAASSSATTECQYWHDGRLVRFSIFFLLCESLTQIRVDPVESPRLA